MDRLDLEKLFAAAIGRENEAFEFYGAAAKKVVDPSVRETFMQLAGEELGHRELLERFKYDPTMVMKISAPSADYKIAEATPLPALSVGLKPAEAIALAMKKEQHAVEFYRSLTGLSTDAGLRDIFQNLANMELGHKHRLETMFVSIGYPESF